MKKAGAAALAAIVALALGACGGSGDDGEAEPSSGGNSAEGGQTSITFLAWQSEEGMQRVADAFMDENPDIDVTVTHYGGSSGGEYSTKLQTLIAGNQMPDVFHILSENRTDVIENDLALDLAGDPILDTVEPVFLDLYRGDEGEVYGITFTAWMGGMIYNKDILSDVGYDSFPTSWDDFIAMGKAINETGKIAFLEDQTISSGSLTALIASYLTREGVDSSTWVMDGVPAGQTYSETWNEPLTQWKSAIDEGVLSGESVGVTGDQIKSEFMNGNLAMFRSGNWDAATLDESGVNYGFAPFPAIPGGETFINGGGDPAYAIAADAPAERQEAAKKFLDFMASSDGVELVSAASGAMSISSNYSTDPGDIFRDAYENNLKAGRLFWIDFSKGSTVMVETMFSQQQLLIQGQATVESFTQAMDDSWAKVG